MPLHSQNVLIFKLYYLIFFLYNIRTTTYLQLKILRYNYMREILIFYEICILFNYIMYISLYN